MVSHFKALIWGTLEVQVKQATAGTTFNTVTLSQIIFLTGVPKKSTLITITTVNAVLVALKKQPAVTGQVGLFPNDFMPVTNQGMESTMYQQSGIFEGDTVKGWRAERQKFSIPGHCSDTLIQVIQSSREFSSSVYILLSLSKLAAPLSDPWGGYQARRSQHNVFMFDHMVVSLHRHSATPSTSVLPSSSLWSLIYFSAKGLYAEAPVLQHTWQGTLHRVGSAALL